MQRLQSFPFQLEIPRCFRPIALCLPTMDIECSPFVTRKVGSVMTGKKYQVALSRRNPLTEVKSIELGRDFPLNVHARDSIA